MSIQINFNTCQKLSPHHTSEVVFPGMTAVLRLTAPSHPLPDQDLDIAIIILNDF